MPLSLIVTVVSLVLWVVLAFVLRMPTGMAHLPLAIGGTALVWWWGTTH